MKRTCTLTITLALTLGLSAQNLGSIHKIYVDPSFGTEEGAGHIQEAIVMKLVQSKKVTVVNSLEQADARLTGTGSVHSQEYYQSSNTGSTGSASAGTFWSATTKVRLLNKEGDILWAGEGTSSPSSGTLIGEAVFGYWKSCNGSASSCAAESVVKQQLKALKKGK